MEIWIARDKNGRLAIYKNKPRRGINQFINWIQSDGNYGACHKIAPSLYPEVTWENSPKELIVKEG